MVHNLLASSRASCSPGWHLPWWSRERRRSWATWGGGRQEVREGERVRGPERGRGADFLERRAIAITNGVTSQSPIVVAGYVMPLADVDVTINNLSRSVSS